MRFLNIPKTDNLMLLNVVYHTGNRENKYKDCIDIIYKNIDTGEKFVQCIHEPMIEIYFVKPEYQNFDHAEATFEIEKLDPVICKYKDVPFVIAKKAGPEYVTQLTSLLKQRRSYEAKNIHKYKYVFGSDIDIENWYRIQWELEYGNSRLKTITKGYLDIEIDAIDIPEGYGEPGECPVNAVTVVDDSDNMCHTFLLRNDNNPQIAEFEKNIKKFTNELQETFDETYGKLEYRIYMYDEEIELISDIFKLINTLKLDFVMIWNMSFDTPYLIARIKELGYDPVDIMCSQDFDYKELFFKKDLRNFKIENKSDYFKISSYTTYLDQMIMYAALRKGGSELRSNALNAVAKVELNDEKLDYSEEADMKTFAYKNYWKFIIYNIKDTLLQLGIERKTSDIDNIYLRSTANVTPYNKIFKQTVFIMDRAYVEYHMQGLIIGNNQNIQYGVEEPVIEKETDDDVEDEEDKKFSGALVADPELNLPVGMKIMGVRSKYAFNNVVDMDFSSMYPYITITFNIAPNCMIGKLVINYIPQDKVGVPKYDSGQDLVDNFLTTNPSNFGTKWLDLPTFETLDMMIKKEFNILPKTDIIIDKDYKKYDIKIEI